MSALLAVSLALALVFVPVLADIGIVNRARAQAENVADAASLAAAQEMIRGGDPATAAASYVARNGGVLGSVVTEDRTVVVTVEQPCPTILVGHLGFAIGPARGRGKAELVEIDDPDY